MVWCFKLKSLKHQCVHCKHRAVHTLPVCMWPLLVVQCGALEECCAHTRMCADTHTHAHAHAHACAHTHTHARRWMTCPAWPRTTPASSGPSGGRSCWATRWVQHTNVYDRSIGMSRQTRPALAVDHLGAAAAGRRGGYLLYRLDYTAYTILPVLDSALTTNVYDRHTHW